MMVVYKYEAIDSYGKLTKGYMEANSLEMVSTQLKQKSLRVLQVKKALFRTIFFFQKVSKLDLALWAKSVTQLLRVGMNLNLVMQTVGEKAGKLSAVTNELNNELNNGSSFSKAASRFKYVFGGLFVGLMNLAEHTGCLISSFEYIAKHYEFVYKINRQTKAALYYPLLLSMIVLPISLFFVFYLVPIFAQMIVECGGELGYLTSALCGIASFCNTYYLVILFVFAMAIVGGIIFRLRCKDIFVNLMLKMPLIGTLMHQFYLTLFFHVFGEMIKSGMSLVKALEIGASMLEGKYVKEILTVKDQIILGQKLTQAIKDKDFFTDISVKMIGIGEQVGELQEVSAQIGMLYEDKLQEDLNKVQQTITPVFMSLLGGLFLLIIFGGILPLYQVISIL